MAANRVGKSEAGAYEVTCHLTGLYPPWWEGTALSRTRRGLGQRHEQPDDASIVQVKLLGSVQAAGTYTRGCLANDVLGTTIYTNPSSICPRSSRPTATVKEAAAPAQLTGDRVADLKNSDPRVTCIQNSNYC